MGTDSLLIPLLLHLRRLTISMTRPLTFMPLLNHVSGLGDTPHTRKSDPQESRDDFTGETTFTGVVEGLGSAILEVDYDFFQRNILPPLHPSIDIDKILTRLKVDGILVSGRWQQFAQDPWEYAVGDVQVERSTENKVFADLELLVHDIVERSEVDALEKTLTFKCLPDYAPICSFETKTRKPNAFFVFDEDRRDPDNLHWCSIATPAEFRLQDRCEDVQSDINKICWNMHQVMREDPRRRFVFGFTIENTRMRVWMLNRSGALVTEPFNFITDHEKFLHFFLSHTYTFPHQLGIDTTMSVVQETSSGKMMYDISVHDAKSPNSEPIVFRTDGLINDDGAKSPLGRGTRIWRVKRLVDGEPEDSAPGRVLKDSWVDEDRDREGKIMEKIITQPGLSDSIRPALAGLFLTHVVSGDILIDGKPDSTRNIITGAAEIPCSKLFLLSVPLSHKPSHNDHTLHSITPSNHPIATATPTQRAKIVRYSQKQHHRIVFVEECEPLSKQTSLLNVFKCLANMTNGLSMLHINGIAGWVHRDISPGNILYVRETGKWVLSDVEYAKRLENDGVHEIRTGTANFMAVEVDCGMYLTEVGQSVAEPPVPLQESPEDIAKQTANGIDFDNEHFSNVFDTDRQLQHADPSSSAFRYNPTHDLESLFWIAVYFVINKQTRPAMPSDAPNHQPSTTSPPGGEAIPSHHILGDDKLKYARTLFYGLETRMKTLMSDAPLQEYFKFLPDPLPRIGARLCTLRSILRNHYAEIEKPGYQIDQQVCQTRGLYVLFKAHFTDIVNILKPQDIIVSPLPYHQNAQGVLRSAHQSGTALMTELNANLKCKAATEAQNTSVLPTPKRSKPAQDSSEPSDSEGSKDLYNQGTDAVTSSGR